MDHEVITDPAQNTAAEGTLSVALANINSQGLTVAGSSRPVENVTYTPSTGNTGRHVGLMVYSLEFAQSYFRPIEIQDLFTQC